MSAPWRIAVSSRATAIGVRLFSDTELWRWPTAPRYRGPETGRGPSRVKRRTSGTGDRMSAKARNGTPIGGPRNADHFNIRAVEDHRSSADNRVMRSGKAEYAMSAAGVVGIAGRQFRVAPAVMEAQLESGGAVRRVRRKRKSAERDQQALRGDSICDKNTDKWAQQAPGNFAPNEHPASHENDPNIRRAGLKATSIQFSSDRAIWATTP